jgi:hypothetical protein
MKYGLERFSPKGRKSYRLSSISSSHDPKDEAPIYIHYSLLDLKYKDEVLMYGAMGPDDRDITRLFLNNGNRKELKLSALQRYLPGNTPRGTVGFVKVSHVVEFGKTVVKVLPKNDRNHIFPDFRLLMQCESICLSHGFFTVNVKLQMRVQLACDKGIFEFSNN